jgi:molecular chaperone DnaJ
VTKKDPYAVLGVGTGATEDEVKKAYRRLALEHHPDKNPGNKAAETKFKEATEAYQILSDPSKRSVFDTFSAPPIRPSRGRATGGFSIEDILGGIGSPFITEEILRGVASRRAHVPPGTFRQEQEEPRAGEDLETEVAVTLEEAAVGCVRHIVIKAPKSKDQCGSCGGSGGHPGAARIPCMACSGRGRHLDFQVGPGPRVRNCAACRGRGDTPAVACKSCGGSGSKPLERDIQVRIPAGIGPDSKLRLAGMGSPGVGMPPGDLYVKVRILSHERFERSDQDLHTTVGVSLVDAIRGAVVTIVGLDQRPVEVAVPAGTSSGEVFTIHGAGIRSPMHNRVGSLHVKISVEVPKKLSARANKLLEELADEMSKPVIP